MKQKVKCSSCGKEHFTTMLKVYVFKKHTCPDDKTILVKSEDGNMFGCPKCEKVFRRTVPTEWNNMGTKIEGSTRSFEEKAKRLFKEPNTEVENIMIPEQSMCQGCRNYQTREIQANQNRERKLSKGIMDNIRAVPKEVTDADIYRYEVFRKTQDDFNETRKAEAYEKQKQERAAAEAERKKKLEEQMKQAQLPTKEEMKPLIDPETMRIEQEAKAKDIRIAELQKQKEEEEKLRDDLKKQDEKIKSLKKKLEKAQEG